MSLRPTSEAEPRTLTIPVPDRHVARRWLLRLLVIGIALYVIWLVREIWLPLGLAFLIATVLDPVVDRMEQRGWKRVTATAFIFGSFLIIVTGLLILAIPAVYAQVVSLQEQFARYFPDTSRQGLARSFRRLNVPASIAAIGVRVFAEGQAGFNRSSSYLADYGMRFVTNLVWVVIVPIVAFYALRDFHLILGKVLLLVPRRNRGMAETYVGEVSAIFARYLRALVIVSALNGLATWLLLTVLRVPSSLLLGLIAGVLYTVPYIGALMTIVLTAAVSFVGGGVGLMAVAVGASVLLHQVFFDQIVSPRILGGHVGLHPILAIIALLAGNLLLGIIGMILAVPVAACVQIGVLALVPKLKMEIDLPAGEGRKDSEEAVAQAQSHADASADLHQSVREAVTHVEAKVQPPAPPG